MISRLKKTLFPIYIATSNKGNEELIHLCKSISIPYFVGSEENVLERFIQCAEKYSVDIIIRVCADCPFVEPEGIIALVEAYKKNSSASLIHNKHVNGYPFGTGAELVPLSLLKSIMASPHDKGHEEHVITYILDNPHKFEIIKLDAPENLKKLDYFLTVDYPRDFELFKEIINHTNPLASLTDIVTFLKNNPSAAKLNEGLHDGFYKNENNN